MADSNVAKLHLTSRAIIVHTAINKMNSKKVLDFFRVVLPGLKFAEMKQEFVLATRVEWVVVLEHFCSLFGPEISNFGSNIHYCSPNKLSAEVAF